MEQNTTINNQKETQKQSDHRAQTAEKELEAVHKWNDDRQKCKCLKVCAGKVFLEY